MSCPMRCGRCNQCVRVDGFQPVVAVRSPSRRSSRRRSIHRGGRRRPRRVLLVENPPFATISRFGACTGCCGGRCGVCCGPNQGLWW